ncbi:unnamed protein product [Toxocara canis]|uniref:TIL domain-containing protein n=1 Tax=Toxocara canis TaxID=6265 RepID=A0A183UIV2_TOXCA|nr:unnamed protein product [Toxocara canis]
MCEPTCLSRPNEPCPRGCGPPKCECLSGFVRYEGRCIRRDQCPASGAFCRFLLWSVWNFKLFAALVPKNLSVKILPKMNVKSFI